MLSSLVKMLLATALALSLGGAGAAGKQMEKLGRGVVALPTEAGVFVSWRLLGTAWSP